MILKNVIVERSKGRDQWFVKEDGLIVKVEYSEAAATKKAKEFEKNRTDRIRMIEEGERVKS